MQPVVAVIGQGILADIVCTELNERCSLIRQNDLLPDLPKAVELVLVVHDTWPNAGYDDVEEAMRKAGKPWLRGVVSSRAGLVGPLVRPGKPGCSECADNRRMTANSGQSGIFDMPQAPLNAAKLRAGIRHAAQLLVSETEKVLQGGKAFTEDHIYVVDLSALQSSLHYYLPDPLCRVCGRLPDDSAAAARIVLRPTPKSDPDSYRSLKLDNLKQTLVHDYLDRQSGLLNADIHDLEAPFAVVAVNVPSFATGDEIASGRSHRYSDSRTAAILEGLERYCGMAPRGKQTAIFKSFNEVKDIALDPVKVGLYTEKQYALPDFPFEPFDPEFSIGWVWGYSFLRQRPILVPESLAYYSGGFFGAFVQEGSNGCALGGSLTEAILYGILEVAERDSFLMTWYAQMAVPRLDYGSANDKELILMVQRLRTVAGYDVHLFDITMENGIPSILALAKAADKGKMNLICGAGAHLDPIRAAKSAIHELASMNYPLQQKFEENKEHIEQMFHDPFLVRQMEHHALLYGLPQCEERLSFLLQSERPIRSFDERFKAKVNHADLTHDLKAVIQAFEQLNLDVIAVNQSSPETLRNGLYCVKVLIPGMLPMSFGHHLARVAGLERLLRVPKELGYADKPLTMEQLNQHPHPFI